MLSMLFFPWHLVTPSSHCLDLSRGEGDPLGLARLPTSTAPGGQSQPSLQGAAQVGHTYEWKKDESR